MDGRGIVVGCCGWPEARAQYAREFRAVELQDTFYEPPAVELAEEWRRDAPPSFLFAMKAWQLITHRASSPTWRRLKHPPDAVSAARCGAFQPTDEVWSAWQRTLSVARAAAASVVVFQCPASLTCSPENIANIESFFRRIERDETRLLAWEPRGPWPPGVVRDLCRKLNLVHAVDPFSIQPVFGRAVYFRLHGRGGHEYRYADQELWWLRDRCAALRQEDRGPIYVMFNNSSMREDALRFRTLLGEFASLASSA